MRDALGKSSTCVCFGDVVKLSAERSSDPEKDGFERFVGLDHIDPEDLKIRRWGDVGDGTTFTSVFRPGQVLFGKRRAYQRKVAVADFSGVCSGDIYVLEPKNANLLGDLLPFICQTDGFFEHAVGTSAGSLSPRTKWESLASYEFVLPRPDEQRRVVNVLTASDYSTESKLRVLDAAHTLRLALLEELFPADDATALVALGELMADGLLSLQTGPFGTVLAAAEYSRTGWPIVNPTNIKSGRIAHVDGPCVSDSTAKRLGAYRMRSGDIVLARKGEIDKAVLVEPEQTGWIAGSDTILLRADTSTLAPSYLLLFLQSPGTGKLLRSLAHGTVMPGLNEGMLARLRIRLRPLAEQTHAMRIVQELDAATINARGHLERARRLRRALLTEALEPAAEKH